MANEKETKKKERTSQKIKMRKKTGDERGNGLYLACDVDCDSLVDERRFDSLLFRSRFSFKY